MLAVNDRRYPREPGANDGVDARPVARVHDVRAKPPEQASHANGIPAIRTMRVAHGEHRDSRRDAPGEGTRARGRDHRLLGKRDQVLDEAEGHALEAAHAERGDDLDDAWPCRGISEGGRAYRTRYPRRSERAHLSTCSR